MKPVFTPTSLYRLPWNMTDNAISWLEPTSKCNMYCDGCYRKNRMNSHKSLGQIQHELDVFEKYRKTDAVSIAGGEPLTHPNILDIIKMVKKKGWKANLNTNALALNEQMTKDLKKAGLDSFTIHLDSGQTRAGWKNKNELELNELRLLYAEMINKVGGISLAFNATVYPETLKYMPDLMKFAQEHMDKIHVMVFILYRMAILGKDFDYYAGGQKVEFDDMMYSTKDDNRRTDITSPELVDIIRKEYPGFMPCAYLNGTEKPDSYKWLLTGRMGNKHKIFGYVGPKFMEIVQTMKHFFTGSYLSYAHPREVRRGRSFFWLFPFDKGIRNIMKNYFSAFRDNPKAFFKKLHYQSVMIIQPADMHEDGRVNMCDGCPDITVWGDELVWSCRMEEQMEWGQNVRMVPKEKSQDESKEEDIPEEQESPVNINVK